MEINPYLYDAKINLYKRIELKQRGASRGLNLETLYFVRNTRSARPCNKRISEGSIECALDQA